MTDTGAGDLAEVLSKLNVIITLLLQSVRNDEEFNNGKRKTGDLVAFLKRRGLAYEDIASILDSPVTSVRELARRKGQAAKRKKKGK